MKAIIIILVCFVSILNFLGCATSQYTVSANGDKADVKFKSGKEFTGELVSISDSAVYLATIPGDYRNSPVLYYFPNSEIKSIAIQGYDGSSWLPWVMLFQVLPAGLLTG
ncbi:MAG: hypothetical protein P8Z35_03590, partial [Ignavibacteriaceae bacterium]